MRGRNYNGLGGLSSHASSMISSLKSNLKARNIDNFKSSKISATYKKGSIDKKASPKLLKEIREKTIRENKTCLIKNVILLSIIFTVSFLIIWFS
jgi:hypothetical protein